MIKRTIEISAEPAHLRTRHGQLVLERDGILVGSVPCEDLGMVVVDHPATTYSHAALTALLEHQAVVVICGRTHLPQGLLLPLAEHTEVVWRIDAQISASRPLKKRLWKQLVETKIREQAANLPPGPEQRKLLAFAREVKSGDSTNREAQAAKVYWRAWLTGTNTTQGDILFRRNREGESPNSLLNYGYSVVRAALARSLVAAGLLPAVGIHHSNRSNAFCLADDLLEPLRPIVEQRVRDLYWAGHTDLDRQTKAALLELLCTEVSTAAKQNGPLMVALHRYAASLVRCYQREQRELEIPVRCR